MTPAPRATRQTETTAPRYAWNGSRPLYIVRGHVAPRDVWFEPHCHEYCEVFWCEAGSGVHIVDGEPRPITAGDIVFLRPNDVHSGRSDARQGMTIVNASFSPASARAVQRRYPADWPWRPGPVLHAHVSPRRMERLHAWAIDLSMPNLRQVDLECFLLDLVRLVARPLESDVDTGLPAWLRGAVEVFCDPRHLPGGTTRLAELAGRTPEHINRVVRSAQGRTTTELVNVVRMAWAASMLRISDQAIGDIAAICGLPHLGHFYATFKATFGVTPRRYRIDARQPLRT